MFERCALDDVIDGDSLRIIIDTGFDHTARVHVRLLGVDCPERKNPEAWRMAREFSATWMAESGKMTLECFGREKYGRWLGKVRNSVGVSLSDALIASGFGVPYTGGKR